MRPGQLNSQISHLNSTKCQVFSMGSVVSISSTGSHATCWWSQGWHVFFHINDLPAHHQGWNHGISPRGLSKKTWLPPFLPANRYDMDWYGLIKGIESTITRSLTHALLIRPLLILAWNNGGTVCFFGPLDSYGWKEVDVLFQATKRLIVFCSFSTLSCWGKYIIPHLVGKYIIPADHYRSPQSHRAVLGCFRQQFSGVNHFDNFTSNSLRMCLFFTNIIHMDRVGGFSISVWHGSFFSCWNKGIFAGELGWWFTILHFWPKS